MKKQLDNWVFSITCLIHLLLHSYLFTQKYTHQVGMYVYLVFILCTSNFFLEYCLNRKLSLQQKAIPFALLSLPFHFIVLASYLFYS